MSIRGLLATLVVPVLLLSACGGGGATKASDRKPTPSATPASASSSAASATSSAPAPTGPACASVWRDGATLPHTYDGCVAHGVAVTVQDRYCEFGKRLVTYADHFYAVRTGTIHRTRGPLEKDRGYRAAMASCLG